MAIFPKWENNQILSRFMFISISRPNHGRLTDNDSDSGSCVVLYAANLAYSVLTLCQ